MWNKCIPGTHLCFLYLQCRYILAARQSLDWPVPVITALKKHTEMIGRQTICKVMYNKITNVFYTELHFCNISLCTLLQYLGSSRCCLSHLFSSVSQDKWQVVSFNPLSVSPRGTITQARLDVLLDWADVIYYNEFCTCHITTVL